MSVRTDVVNLQLNINGNVAQNKLNDLRKQAADVRLQMAGLKKGTEEYIQKNAELKRITSEMASLKKEIGITALNQKELTSELNRLKALRGSVVPFSAEFKDLSKQIKEVENRLYDVRNGVQGFSSFFSKIKDEVKQFGVMAAGYLGFQFISSQFQNIIQGAGKMSDQLADLQRVTGMTAEESKALNAQLSQLDTRTSTGGLREIAIVAGKLGVAKDDIFEFTQAVDMLTVALGDELGNADAITETLGKILNVFDGEVNGDNISRLGNAFVELANAGVASGAFIADFDQRLSGIAKSAGIGLGELSGLGAGIEELGGRVASSATAIQKLIVKISSDIPQAAQVAGMAVDQYEKLFQLDPTEALLRYSEGLVKNKKNFSEITAAFSEVDESGASSIETITKLGESADLMRTRIKQGATAFQETGAIIDAYDLKNNTLGATLDKLGKEFNKLITSSTLKNFLEAAVEGVLSFISVLKQVPKFINDNSTALKLLLAGIVLLNLNYVKLAAAIVMKNAALVANTIAQRATAIATNISSVSQAAYLTVTALLTKQITLATAAQRLWNIALSIGAGPLGVIIALIGVATVAATSLVNSFKKFNAEQTALSAVATRAADAYGQQVRRVRDLQSVLMSSTATLGEKRAAYEKLIEIHPDFAKTLKLDEDGHVKGMEAIDDYIDALKRKSVAQAAEELALETNKEILKLRQKIADEEIHAYERNLLGVAVKTKEWKELEKLYKLKEMYDGMVSQNLKNEITAAAKAAQDKKDGLIEQTGLIEDLQKKIKDLDDARPKLTTKKEIDENLKMRKKHQDELDALEGRTKKNGGKKDDGYERLKKEAEEFKKYLEKLRRDAELGRLSDDDREIQQAQDKYAELLTRAKKYWAENTAAGKAAVADIVALRSQELDAILAKQFERRSTKEYEESLQELDKFFDQQRNAYGLEYANGIINKQQYEAKLSEIETTEVNSRLMVAKDYAETSKKAAGDVAKFAEAAQKKETADAIIESEKRKKLRESELLAGARLNVLTSRRGSKGELDARKQELELKFQLETEFLDKTSNLYLQKEEEKNQAIRELEIAFKNQRIDEFMQYVDDIGNALSGLNTIIGNMEERELQRDRKRNNEKKNAYKKQLDNKLISQAQYDKEIQRINEEQERKEKEIQIRQAKRQKAISLFEAITSTAAGIAKALPNLFLAAMVAAMGAIQIGTIASSPLPEMGDGGLLKKGPKHSDKAKGLHVVNPETGRTEMLLERDEAVLNARAMKSPKKVTITGTPSQIASGLNSMYGGVSWHGGAMVQQPEWISNKQPQIQPNVIKLMALGGVVGEVAQQQSQNIAALNDQAPAIVQMNNGFEQLITTIEKWPRELKSKVVLKDIDDTRNYYDAAKKASGLNN
ncbi:MAG TPA: phage tail tape measure protein [Ferruginibacter sp.]|nr:phage tail tape measure protein [Ferruginibacter sp.]HRQ20520.1 phage tail tape measure protein [Ferruginibacter sp.]